jgi:DNA-binding IclR family transcriptional regulator
MRAQADSTAVSGPAAADNSAARAAAPAGAAADDGGVPRRGEAAGGVKSAYRTVEVLELLADAPGRLTLAQLQRRLGVPKSSLHGLLQTLVMRGWVDERGGGYGVGLRALRVGAAYLDRDPMVRAGGPLLAALQRHLDETVHLARLDGADVVYLASRESQHHLRVVSRIGRRLPAHATALGRALLAARSPAEADALLPETLAALTPDTVTDRRALHAELAETRVRGWAYEAGQNTPGLCCFAVAIPSAHPAVYALSCSIPLARLSDDRGPAIVSALAECAGELRHSA